MKLLSTSAQAQYLLRSHKNGMEDEDEDEKGKKNETKVVRKPGFVSPFEWWI